MSKMTNWIIRKLASALISILNNDYIRTKLVVFGLRKTSVDSLINLLKTKE